jgi:hypothetical protein
MNREQLLLKLSCAAFVLLLFPSFVFGQFVGENIRGDYGMNSGTQGPPGYYLILPYYLQNVDEIRNADSNSVLPGVFGGFELHLFIPTIYAVTSKKILGGNYGFSLAVPFSNYRPERVSEQNNVSGWGVSDTYVSPFILGWTKQRADFVVSYAFDAPTGSYVAGGDNNFGLGMWSHEIQGGTTVYLDAMKKYSVATSAFLEMHTSKKDQDLRVGNILTLEGGAGYNIEKIGGAFGVGYAFQQKVSNDSGSDVPVKALQILNLYGKNRVLGWGPDLTTGLFQKGRTVGSLTVRYLWDTAGKSSPQGSILFFSFTVGRLAAP